MKITVNQLKRIIKEEVSKVLREGFEDGSPSPGLALADAATNAAADGADGEFLISMEDLIGLDEFSKEAYQECLDANVFERGTMIKVMHDSNVY